MVGINSAFDLRSDFQREELSRIKINSVEGREWTAKERQQRIVNLLAKIDSVKSDIGKLDSKPILLHQHLEDTM